MADHHCDCFNPWRASSQDWFGWSVEERIFEDMEGKLGRPRAVSAGFQAGLEVIFDVSTGRRVNLHTQSPPLTSVCLCNGLDCALLSRSLPGQNFGSPATHLCDEIPASGK